MMMLYNFILASRNIKRQKFYSAINILGFALGIAVFFFISVYIVDQMSYDRWVENADRVYRLEKGEWAATGSAYGPYMHREYPEVESVARVIPGSRGALLQYGSFSFPGNRIIYADSSIFDIISFKFIAGNPQTALTDPHSIVLTESLALNIFGTTNNVIGRVLRIHDMTQLQVTALIEDVRHFHIPGNAIVPFHLLTEFYPDNENLLYYWGGWNFITFVLLAPETDVAHLEKKINEAFHSEILAEIGLDTEKDYFLRPFRDIYFANDVRHEPPVLHGNMQNIKMFLAIAVFILLIAIVNFVNLSTARSSLRSHEVGIRKLLGSNRISLVLQIIAESVVITTFAVVLALVFLETGLPWFNDFAGTTFRLRDLNFPAIVGLLLLCSAFVGVLSGIYPSLYLTASMPVDVVKGDTVKGKKGAFFRKALIIFQFLISISLIIATMVIHEQLRFMQRKDSGIMLEQTLVVRLNQQIFKRLDAFKQQLEEHSGTIDVGFSAQIPGSVTWQETANVNELGDRQYTLMPVSANYPEMMGMELLSGNFFTEDYQSEAGIAVLFNEQAVRYFGYKGDYEEVVGQPFKDTFNDYRIVGVVRDFHYNSLHNSIGPLVILWTKTSLNYANIRINANNMPEAISHINKVWKEFSPVIPFEYFFLDDVYMSKYDQDKQLSQIFLIFSAFAILIACLGLFGLASFMAERRMREMAVRKVMGARTSNLVILMSKDFLKLVILAFVVAAPISFYFLHEWLNTFPYRIHIPWIPFAFALLSAMVVTFITVSYHAIRVSNVNPGDVLKYE
jgi:putative ABC transport system permease protein